MADARVGRVEVSKRDVRSVLKSPGVVGWVTETSDRLAASASSQAMARRDALPKAVRREMHRRGDFDRAPYSSRTKIGTHTAFGVVGTATADGAYDQNQNHTLDSLNH